MEISIKFIFFPNWTVIQLNTQKSTTYIKGRKMERSETPN